MEIEGWITYDKAKELFQASGRDLEALKKAATRRDFRPESLNCQAQFAISNTLREIQSRNVVAKLEGSDPSLKDETVIYTAHWDHLGRDPALSGDQIFNGAVDNASGVAMVLEIARAFTRVQPAPKRSIVFLAVTAEEKGLLGAKYYAAHPLCPLDRTLANINIDGINLWGPTKDIISIGMGQLDPRRPACRAGPGARPHGPSRCRTGKGLLLPLGSLRVRQARRPRARSRWGSSIHRQARRFRPAETRRVHSQGLP